MFIDTHCHLSNDYYDDIDNIINENKEAGISKIVVSGCEEQEIKSSINYINKYDIVYATIGYHPSECLKVTNKLLDDLEDQIKYNKKIVGVGEIGLDYHYGKEYKDLQKEIFEKQLQLAQKLNLPVVIHSRDATLDTINILKKYKLKGIIHCFSGSLETAKVYVNMGYYLGIGGVITFKNSKLDKVIEKIDLKSIVLETDSPYLTPEPFRGKKNSSKYIPIIAKKIADIKKIDIEEVSRVTLDNTYKLFDLK